MSSEEQNISTDTSESTARQAPQEASASSMDDRRYVQKALKGNEHAFKTLMDKYDRGLRFHITKMMKDRAILEDLIQEIFIKAFNNLANYNPEYAFSTWLYRIASNHTIDYLRKKKLRTLSIDEPINTRDGSMQVELPDTKTQTDEPIIKNERKKMVQEAIQELPEKYKRVIQMRHMEELSYQEIAEELDVPIGTVKAHIFRAREMLYKAMKDKIHRY